MVARARATCQDRVNRRLELGAIRLKGNNMKKWAKRKEGQPLSAKMFGSPDSEPQLFYPLK
jgi:hypothetical protein